MNIFIPETFNNILSKNNELSGKLNVLLDTFSKWLSENKMEFFPDYTDHGINHIQSVINTTESIITDKSLELLSSEDIYLLISSILLHDCAMHLNREGLWDLIRNDAYNGVPFLFNDDKEWSIRWEDFKKSVNRFNENDWHAFFDDYRLVELPEVGAQSLNDDQKIVIGDFIRSHHASISQLIATYGIPTKNGPVKIFDNDLTYLNQLSGVIARSHNHNLREVVDLLGEERKREHRNAHPTFIMGLLRVADYMQFNAKRTPKILFKTKGFCSPVSFREWKKHLAIISTNDAQPDEELIFVEAFPDDAVTLVHVKKLLNGFQKELDEFWASIGEVYSRYPRLKHFSIKYRRVKSNIDKPKKYVAENHKSYHPELLSIKSDNQKLFPLLIKPLYGNHPQIGIRELVQNSIDACNERFCRDSNYNVIEHDIPYSIDITMNFDNSTLIIDDAGVGMNIEIINEYFLKIGSSYRASEYWKSIYSDQDNNSYIPRTGKFGIGMLAGFLIGNKIDVLTKHVSENSKPVKFTYSIDSSEIELSYASKDKVGTKIIIHSNNETLNLICDSYENSPRKKRYYSDEAVINSWWYYMDTPRISVKWISEGKTTNIKRQDTIFKNSLRETWNRVEDTELELFLWKFNNDYHDGKTYCNGVYIHEQESPELILSLGGLEDIKYSNIDICVFDNHGKFPLSLTREKIVTSKYYEQNKLQNSFKNLIVKELILTSKDINYNREEIANFIGKYSHQHYNGNKHIPLIFCTDNVKPFSCKSLSMNSALIFVDFAMASQKRGVIYDQNSFSILDGMPYSCFVECDKYQETVEKTIEYFIQNKYSNDSWRRYSDSKKSLDVELESWVFLKKYDFKKLSGHFKTSIKNKIYFTYEVSDDWVVITNKESINHIPHQGMSIIKANTNNKFFMFAFYKQKNQTETEISTLWNRLK